LFMRDLNLIANDEIALKRFLSTQTVGIVIEGKVIKVDPKAYISPNGDR